MGVLKYLILSLSLISLINCAPKDLDAQPVDKVSQEGQNNINNSDVEMGTASDVTILPAPTNPIPLPDLQNNNNSGGFLSNLLGGLFGSGSGCNLLSTLLGIGGTLLSGNPLIGNLGAQLPGLLFNCGGSSSFAGLIPNGASDQNQIFQILAHILQQNNQGQNPFALITQIKKPEDVTAMIGIVAQLLQQGNGDSKLQDILNKLLKYQSYLNHDTTDTCGSMNPVACRVFNLINQVRADNNLPAFKFNPGCADASQAHTLDMALNRILTHLSSNGQTTSQRLLNFGIAAPWAENIVKGKTLTAEQAVEMWMKSPGHRKNILSNLFNSTGIGYVNGYFTQCFAKN